MIVDITLSPEHANLLPLDRLAHDLVNGDTRAVEHEGDDVVPRGFYSLLSIAAVPDQLIAGIINNTMAI